jgi:hypothetical protein
MLRSAEALPESELLVAAFRLKTEGFQALFLRAGTACSFPLADHVLSGCP